VVVFCATALASCGGGGTDVTAAATWDQATWDQSTWQ